MHLVSWDNAVNRDRAELIFSNRNHEYGGYVIRRDYNKVMVYALLYTLLGVALIIAIPTILKMTAGIEVIPIPKPIDEGGVTWVPPIDQPVIMPPAKPIAQPPSASPYIFKPSLIAPETPIPDPTTPATTGEGTSGPIALGPTGPITQELPASGPTIEIDEKPRIFAEEMPVFAGGEAGLFAYIAKHIRYPIFAKENGIIGVIHISFVVDKQGMVRDAKVLGGIGAGCDEEALRVISSLPQWKPGKQNGKPVSVLFNIPVRFSLK